MLSVDLDVDNMRRMTRGEDDPGWPGEDDQDNKDYDKD